MGFFDNVGSFLFGAPEKMQKISKLRATQEPLADQLFGAGMGPGAGGAFGTSADYYRNLLSDNPEDFQSFAAPEMRQFNEQIIPDLAEQFAGMGSGNLSSSGFRNAAVNAGADLSERLGALRAQLRQQGAQGLMNIGQQGLQPFDENVIRPRSDGFLGAAAKGLGQAIPALAGNYGFGLGLNSMKGKSSPYGNENISRGYSNNNRLMGG